MRIDLVELFGSGYVIDYCVSAFSKKQKDLLYKVYITDALRAIAGTNVIPKRYYDLLETKPQVTQSSQEVISKIKNKFD